MSKPTTPKNREAFDKGFVDGFCQKALDWSLFHARGELLSKRELSDAVAQLQVLPLAEIARRVLAAKNMPAGQARLDQIIGK